MKTNGFTLIELMIVVAIIGILASMASAEYQNYTRRAHAAEGLELAASARIAVAEFYAGKGSPPGNNTSAGLPTTINGHAVNSVTISAGGLITITYNTLVDSGKTIVLNPAFNDGSIEWECKSLSTAPIKYRPSICR